MIIKVGGFDEGSIAYCPIGKPIKSSDTASYPPSSCTCPHPYHHVFCYRTPTSDTSSRVTHQTSVLANTTACKLRDTSSVNDRLPPVFQTHQNPESTSHTSHNIDQADPPHPTYYSSRYEVLSMTLRASSAEIPSPRLRLLVSSPSHLYAK